MYWLVMMSEENYRYMRSHLIYGLPESSKDLAEEIKPGDRLVVYIMMKKNCKELCGSFTAVVEVVGEWRESSKPQFPEEEEEGRILYPRIVNVKFIAEGVVKFDEVKDELSKVLGKKDLTPWILTLSSLYYSKKPLPEEAGELIERALRRGATVKPQSSIHDELVEMVRDIGVWLGFKAEINHKIDNFWVDVAFFKGPRAGPYAVVEVHVRGDIYKDLAALKHAYDKYGSRPIYVIANEDVDQVLKLVNEAMQGAFHEIREQIIIIRHSELVQLHNTLRNENIKKLINELKK